MFSPDTSQSNSIAQLLTNPKNVFLECAKILLKYAEGIIENPDNPKFRKIRIGNPSVQEKLMPIYGAMECLFEMGFQEDGEYLFFPVNSSLQQLQIIRDSLIKESQKFTGTLSKLSGGETVPKGKGISRVEKEEISQSPFDISMSEQRFYRELVMYQQKMNIYESPSIQRKAVQVIPVKEIETNAFKRLADLLLIDASVKADLRDIILIELLDWFKNKFFTWVNNLPCSICKRETTLNPNSTVTLEEERWGCQRVECFQCISCNSFERFPRYQNPEKLLETRRGRCGEWANCFALCCRALMFETRFVSDWNDHVWTEVFSECQKRWLHCDPCENIYDQPLVYELGWGKKTTYIIAFSIDEIVDVTWRYTCNPKELEKRRTLVRPEWLSTTLLNMNKNLQSSMPTERLKILQSRMITEFIEFLTPQKGTKNDYSGRTSGSLVWRLTRGEAKNPSDEGYIFHLTQMEKNNKIFHLKYNCASDCYTRISDSNHVTEGWTKCCAKINSVIRKVEHDWNMAYLARVEGTDNALVSWEFDFEKLLIDKAQIKVCCKTYETGVVQWILKMNDKEVVLKENEMQPIPEASQSSGFTIQADLSGGIDRCAWQHSQLFRQPCKSEDYPFEVHVTFL